MPTMNPSMKDVGMREADSAMDTTATFDAIYDAEFTNVYRFATNRLGRDDGEEVTADVFHAAALAFADGHGERVTGAWLTAVARNKVIDRWRRHERRRARAHLVWTREADAIDASTDHWSRSVTRRSVLDALDELPEHARCLLIFRYVDEMSVPDIAEATGASIRSVESALARARRAFRAAYDRLEDQP
jgi:RNA polymerase sigma-70 factor (ECF subfamily)